MKNKQETQYALSLPGIKKRLDKVRKIQTLPSIFTQAELNYLYSHPNLIEQIQQFIEINQKNE